MDLKDSNDFLFGPALCIPDKIISDRKGTILNKRAESSSNWIEKPKTLKTGLPAVTLRTEMKSRCSPAAKLQDTPS